MSDVTPVTATPAAAPAAAPSPSRPPPLAPVAPARPAARAADPAPAPPAPKPVDPSALERFQMSPEQRRALDLAEERANDVYRDPSRLITRNERGELVSDGRRVHADGSLAEPAPGDRQESAPAADKPKNVVRFGDDVTGWTEATSEQIREWQATHSAMESRRLNAPADPSLYEFKLSENFRPPAGYEDWRPDPNHFAAQGARQLAHDIDTGKVSGQQALTRMIELNASSQIGTSMMLQKARDAEIAKLGANGVNRATTIQNFWASVGGAALAKKCYPLLATSAMVELQEKLMARAGGIGGSSFSGQRPAPRSETISESDYNKMSYSDRKAYALRMSGGR
jgi:hypothetical protein